MIYLFVNRYYNFFTWEGGKKWSLTRFSVKQSRSSYAFRFRHRKTKGCRRGTRTRFSSPIDPALISSLWSFWSVWSLVLYVSFYIRIYVCVCVYLLFSLSLKFRFHTIETHDTIPAENAHNVFLLQQGFLLSIVVQKGDVYRIINGYDDCGNVCGRVTPSHPEFQCLDGKNGDNTKNP